MYYLKDIKAGPTLYFIPELVPFCHLDVATEKEECSPKCPGWIKVTNTATDAESQITCTFYEGQAGASKFIKSPH